MVKIFLISLLVMGGFFLFIRWFERANLYMPFRQIEAYPDRFGMDYEEYFYQTPDGEELNAWYLPSPQRGYFTLIYFHGNAGNISHRLQKIDSFLRRGINVFIFDYRGYGKSSGSPSEEGVYIDARASYDFIKKTKNLDPGEIILYGKSLGGSIASHLATEVTPAGIVMNSTFTSVEGMARIIFPFLPVRHFLSSEYNSVENVKKIECPLLIMHSPSDEIVPFRMGEELYAAGKGDKRFCRTSGGHNEMSVEEVEEVADCVASFLEYLREEYIP